MIKEPASEFLLTIAIPTYNRSSNLSIGLNKIAQLNFHQFSIEILIIDNNSTDNTNNIVKDFISKGLPIKYLINERNIGPDANILKCLENAKGYFIHLLSDDDLIEPKIYQKLLELLSCTTDVSMILLNWDHIIYQDGISKYFNTMSLTNKIIKFKNKNELVRHLLIEGLTFLSNKIYQRSIVSELTGLSRFIGTSFLQTYAMLLALEHNSCSIYFGEVALHQDQTNGDLSNMPKNQAIFVFSYIFNKLQFKILDFCTNELHYEPEAISFVFKRAIKKEWQTIFLLRMYYQIAPSINFSRMFKS